MRMADGSELIFVNNLPIGNLRKKFFLKGLTHKGEKKRQHF